MVTFLIIFMQRIIVPADVVGKLGKAQTWHSRIPQTRSPAVARTADHTGCQWPSRSSKVHVLHVIWKPINDFLWMINSNPGPILHRLVTLHPWLTDRQTNRRQPWQQLDRYLSMVR